MREASAKCAYIPETMTDVATYYHLTCMTFEPTEFR